MVYLLHFSSSYRHAQHYVGSTRDLPKRLEQHLKGHGSPLVRAAVLSGCVIDVGRTWKGGWEVERRVKSQKNARRLCAYCNPGHHRNLANDQGGVQK